RRAPGLRDQVPAGEGRRRGRGDPSARLRPARLDLDRRPRPPADAVRAHRRLPGAGRVEAAEGRPDLRVLGARGLPAADRGLPALQAPDGAPSRAPLVGAQARPRPGGEEARSRRDPRARRAADALLRGRRRRGDVELEAREADPRGPVRGRRHRGRGPRRVPAAVRPAGAGDPPRAARRADADGGGVPPRLRAAGGTGPRRADRVGHRRALPLPGRRQGDAADRGRAPRRGPRAPGRGRRPRPAGGRARGRRGRRGAAGRRAGLPVRQPRLGPRVPRARLRLHARDRGVQARPAASVRLLRPAVPPARPARRPRRPQVGPRRGSAARPRLPPRAEGAAVRSTRGGARPGAPAPRRRARSRYRRPVRPVSVQEARRIAVRAQLLDGSATDVLGTVRRLGFLQLDPIATVAPPQYLVLWSRLGRYARGELDRLVWETRDLVEFDAFLYPAEWLPVLRARMRRRPGGSARDRWVADFLRENAGFRRYVLRELERRGPLLSRDIEDHAGFRREGHRWWGGRKMALMLELLAHRGEVAVAGRQGT